MNQFVNSQLWECGLPLISDGALADGGRSCREARRNHATFRGQLDIM